MKGIGPIVGVVILIVVIWLYASQSGAPETGGLGDAAQDALPDSPGDVADKAADGARGAADKGANDVAPWIAQNGTFVAALVLAGIALYCWKKYRVLSIIALTAIVVGGLVMIAT